MVEATSLQQRIDFWKQHFRLIKDWKITFEADSERRNECYWNKKERRAEIYPLVLEPGRKAPSMEYYILHELLHITKNAACCSVKREETLIRDLMDLIMPEG